MDARNTWLQTKKEKRRITYQKKRRGSNKAERSAKIKWTDRKLNKIMEEGRNENSKKFTRK